MALDKAIRRIARGLPPTSNRHEQSKPRYSDEEQGKAAPSRQECITPQNRLRRCLRGPRRGSPSNAVRVQGGFDAVIRQIARGLPPTQIGTNSLNRDIRMKNKEKPPRADRSALPRKIACGDVCGDPGGALYQMLCEFKAALTQLFAE